MARCNQKKRQFLIFGNTLINDSVERKEMMEKPTHLLATKTALNRKASLSLSISTMSHCTMLCLARQSSCFDD